MKPPKFSFKTLEDQSLWNLDYKFLSINVSNSFWFDLSLDLWWLVEDVVGFCRIFVVGFVGSAGLVRSDLVVVILKR